LKNYSRSKDEVVFSGIFVDPKRNAPAWVQDREKLWNAASAAEKRKDAREAQEIILNLPHELTDEQRRFMLTDFVREPITRGTGRIADVNMHAAHKHGDDRNIHAHVLMTVREIGPEGFDGKRLEADTKQVLHWKQKWAERGAKELRKAGFEIEADRWAVGYMDLPKQREEALKRGDLAYAETLNREATKHLGPNVASMERKGIETDRGNAHREIQQRNEQARANNAALKRELAEIQGSLWFHAANEFSRILVVPIHSIHFPKNFPATAV
jgi:ATP-dependent exoDNAse (exonuclease V) alpha subunit